MKNLFLIFLSFTISQVALAKFSEIDILVRESVQNFMIEHDKKYDERSFQYDDEPKILGQVMAVNSSVYAKEKSLGKWMIHRCQTGIKIQSQSRFIDLGSVCDADND
jgi:hypothetical protein